MASSSDPGEGVRRFELCPESTVFHAEPLNVGGSKFEVLDEALVR